MSWPCRVTNGDHRWKTKEAGRGGQSASCESCYECPDFLVTLVERDRLAALLRVDTAADNAERPVSSICPHDHELPKCPQCSAEACPECDQPMLPAGEVKRPNEYDHARGCPRTAQAPRPADGQRTEEET